MEVLIVAKTHISRNACVGGYALASNTNVRLLLPDGTNQPVDTPYQIGEVWELDYRSRSEITNPHVEDVIVSETAKRLVRKQVNISTFLRSTALIWTGSPEQLFDGKIYFERAKSGYVRETSLPNQSVGFWISDKNLELAISPGSKHYYYFGDNNEVFQIPYVGYAPVIDKIPLGTLLRVSLARWWTRPGTIEKRCHLQLSGWY